MKLADLYEDETKWTPESVETWLRAHRPRDTRLSFVRAKDIDIINGEVRIYTAFHIDLKGGELPFQLAIHDTLTIDNAKSLKGCPKELNYNFDVGGEIKSFEGAPERIGKDQDNLMPSLYLRVKSCKDIHKHIKYIKGRIEVGYILKEGMLDLLRIEGVDRITTSYSGNPPQELEQVLEILEDNIGKGNAGLVKAQRELLDADLEDYL